MNMRDLQTDALLRQHDPAPGNSTDGPAALAPSEARRAATTLQQILATDPDAGSARRQPAPTTVRQRHARRWLMASLGAVAVAAAVVLPALTTGGVKAYASWSPLPVALSPAEGSVAAGACLDSLGQPAGPRVAPLLAERRGNWTYVLVQPTSKLESSCVMPTAEITGARAGDRRRWFGSSGEVLSDPPPGPDELRVNTAAVGETKEGLFSYSEGVVGRDVVDVTFTTPGGVTVEASVTDGRYAVWWPAGRSYLRSPEISDAPVIDITLTDGTTYRRSR